MTDQFHRHEIVMIESEEYDFITRFDPDRERTASRHQLVEVVKHIQSVLLDGRLP